MPGSITSHSTPPLLADFRDNPLQNTGGNTPRPEIMPFAVKFDRAAAEAAKIFKNAGNAAWDALKIDLKKVGEAFVSAFKGVCRFVLDAFNFLTCRGGACGGDDDVAYRPVFSDMYWGRGAPMERGDVQRGMPEDLLFESVDGDLGRAPIYATGYAPPVPERQVGADRDAFSTPPHQASGPAPRQQASVSILDQSISKIEDDIETLENDVKSDEDWRKHLEENKKGFSCTMEKIAARLADEKRTTNRQNLIEALKSQRAELLQKRQVQEAVVTDAETTR
ncbi:MAG: hypothetical protein JWP38_1639 [Herbaspirillum sp.]|nr:hypothetical protein [Herbaspirillum sp.]